MKYVVEAMGCPLSKVCSRIGLGGLTFEAEIRSVVLSEKQVIVEIAHVPEGAETSCLSFLETAFTRYFKVPTSIVTVLSCNELSDASSAEQFRKRWEEVLEILGQQLPIFGSKPVIQVINGHTVRIVASDSFMMKKLKEKESTIAAWCEKELGAPIAFGWDCLSPSNTPPVVEKEQISTSAESTEIDESKVAPIGTWLKAGSAFATVQGQVFLKDYKDERDNARYPALVFLGLFDGGHSLKAKAGGELAKTIQATIREKDTIVVEGPLTADPKTNEPILSIRRFKKRLLEPETDPEADTSAELPVHVELHTHSHLSAMDSILSVEALVERAAKYGQKAVGITDHEVIQAYPEFYERCQAHQIKPIYGMEGNVVDITPILMNLEKRYSGAEKEFLQETWETRSFCVIDFETTGLSALRDDIIEIGAVKIFKGKIVDTFQSFVKPTVPIGETTTRLTGITEETVREAPALSQILPTLRDFIGEEVIVGHNVNFDYQFYQQALLKTGEPLIHSVTLDTLALARSLLKMSSYTLDKVVKKLGLTEETGETVSFRHHRASEDARVTGLALIAMLEMAKKDNRVTFGDIQNLQAEIALNRLHGDSFTAFVQNKEGLKNLYRIVSMSHLEYLGKVPVIPRNLLSENRDGLFLGTGSPVSELSKAYRMGKDHSELIEIAEFYDFIEIMPSDAYTDIEEGFDEKTLREMYARFYELGHEIGLPVLFTGNVHYLDPVDHKAWSVLKISDIALHRRGQKLSSTLFDGVKLHYRTTQELLRCAEEILEDPEKAKEVVIDNPSRFIDRIELIQPITRTLHPPIIEGAEEEIKTLTLENMRALYGDNPPAVVSERVKRELDAIIGNGYAVLYLIAQKIVAQSLKDGYLVGSRGSVGSSLVATLLEITEVNPMPPHLVCPSCKHCLFSEDPSITSGYDLPDAFCPKCGKKMKKYGQTIPFETFMGFKGNKVPDIDLNFSGEYQAKAHRFIEELFGSEHVFRAGTISTVAEKTAFGYVLRYEEATGEALSEIEKERLAKSIAGVKRTTGQHPGGLMIVPKNYEVYDFTPVQHPANDRHTEIKTTHFDYNSIHEDLVKIDALGHDDPTFMRFLQDCTNVNPISIPMDDRKVIELFSGLRPLKIRKGEIPDVETGTLGVPEFGTAFVRGMLKETKPKSFADLVRISGLSHGTDVWLNNSRDLIVTGKTPLSEVIACRDDIMIDLIQRGLEPIQAFSIMERVRKGKGLSREEEALMTEKGVPEWFMESCRKIKYLFPKAHAVAYVSMGFRVAFFKLYFPLAFYSAFFTIKGWDFDLPAILKGPKKVRECLLSPNDGKNGETKSRQKADGEKFVNEVALEMLLRGFSFLPVDIIRSHPHRFEIEGQSLRIPLNKVPGLGEKVALSIKKAREEKSFSSIEDIKKRTSISNTVIDLLKQYNAFGDLSESAQYTLF